VIAGIFGDHTKMTGQHIGTKDARLLLVGAALAFGVGACHKEQGAAPAMTPAPAVAVKAPVPVKKGPSVEQQTTGMVEAAAQGKPQAAVAIKFELAQQPKIGQTLEINLALIPRIDASPASLKVSGGEGLTVAPEAGQYDIPAIEANSVYRHTVSVTPTADGILIMGVSVSMKHDEVTDLMSFSIPIIVER
jgi:hypothetical protein